MMRKLAATNFFQQSLNSSLAMSSSATSSSTSALSGAAAGGRRDDSGAEETAGGAVGGAAAGQRASPKPRSATLQRADTSAAKNPSHPNAEFFQKRSMSLMEVQMDNTEPEENIGQIQFGLDFMSSSQTLILRIIQAKELPAKDLSGTSDPYVKITILPDKRPKFVTKIKRRTLHPRWNESFYFEGYSFHQLQSKTLHLHVLDYDRFSRDDSIGEILLPLGENDFNDKRNVWRALKPLDKDINGDLLCSLCYHTGNSELALTIIKCRNLKAKDINGKSDPYVKVWLNFGEKRIEKRKTPVHKCTLEPVYNETFLFEVPWERIRECSLDIRVMDYDNVGRNELIGRILLAGKGGTGQSEVKHWQDMIAKTRQTLVQWHRLKGE